MNLKDLTTTQFYDFFLDKLHLSIYFQLKIYTLKFKANYLTHIIDFFVLDSEQSEGSYGFTMMFIFFSGNT